MANVLSKADSKKAAKERAENESEEELPPLTPMEERRYNRLADRMQAFHTGLQSEFELSYELADGSFSKRGMSLSSFLGFVTQFRLHLQMHHDIEERHIFPVLAKRMPEFRDNDRHKTSHKLIHDGLDLLEKTVKGFKSNPSTYKPEELRAALDSFREPLYTHLAEEVRDLSAPNMRKYWSIQDLAKIPM